MNVRSLTLPSHQTEVLNKAHTASCTYLSKTASHCHERLLRPLAGQYSICGSRYCRLYATSSGHQVNQEQAGPLERSTAHLESWLSSKAYLRQYRSGVSCVGSEGLVGIQQLGNGERGLKCTKGAKAGQVLFRIPFNLAMTDQDPEKAATRGLPKDAASSIRLAARLLREKSKGHRSPWAAYIAALPQSPGCMANMFKTPAELDALEYPYIAQKLQSMRTQLRDVYDSCGPSAIGNATYQDFEWAFTVVVSRALGADWWELMMWAGQTHDSTHNITKAASISSSSSQPHDPVQSQTDNHNKNNNDTTGATLPDISGDADWWASDYLSMWLKIACQRELSSQDAILPTGNAPSNSNSRSRTAGSQDPKPSANPPTFLAPLLDMMNHGSPRPQDKHVCVAESGVDADGAQDLGQCIEIDDDHHENVRWYLQPGSAATGTKTGSGFGSKQPKALSNSPQDWEIVVVAKEDIQPGQELRLCYQQQVDNDTFLLYYGFLPGLPGGDNPADEVLLFPGGLQQALDWHCQEFAVKAYGGLSSLQVLSDEELAVLYEMAYDDTLDALQHTCGPEASAAASLQLKLKHGGKAPGQLLHAFAAVMERGQVMAAHATTQSDQGVAGDQQPGGLVGVVDSGLSQSELEAHSQAAVARLCLQRLRAMTPLLADLSTLSTSYDGDATASVWKLKEMVVWADVLREYQDKLQGVATALLKLEDLDDSSVAAAGNLTEGVTNVASSHDSTIRRTGKGEDHIEAAGSTSLVSEAATDAHNRASSLSPSSGSESDADSSMSGSVDSGNLRYTGLALPASSAVQILRTAGVAVDDPAEVTMTTGSSLVSVEGRAGPGVYTIAARIAADMASTAGAAGSTSFDELASDAPSLPDAREPHGMMGTGASALQHDGTVHGRTLELALQYRVSKKRVLWDYVLQCDPQALHIAVSGLV